MSKYAIALMCCVLGCVIGFGAGTYVAASQHKEMETLVRTKNELVQQIAALQTEKENLIQDNSQLNKEVKVLKARMLNVYPSPGL